MPSFVQKEQQQRVVYSVVQGVVLLSSFILQRENHHGWRLWALFGFSLSSLQFGWHHPCTFAYTHACSLFCKCYFVSFYQYNNVIGGRSVAEPRTRRNRQPSPYSPTNLEKETNTLSRLLLLLLFFLLTRVSLQHPGVPTSCVGQTRKSKRE